MDMRWFNAILRIALTLLLISCGGPEPAEPQKDPSTPEESVPTSEPVSGLESLSQLSLQVDKEVNLLQGITIANGVTLTKVEIETGGTTSEIPDASHYSPEYPGAARIILTLTAKDGKKIVVKSDNLTIKGKDYKPLSITNIRPVDVFPQIAQIESWDPNIYGYVKDLGAAETYVMREMMTKYGTGKYSSKEYIKLLSRVNIGLIEEMDDDYQEHGWIWPVVENAYTGDHANKAFKYLTSLKWEHTNIKNLSGLPYDDWAGNLSEYAKAHPNELFLFSWSATDSAYSLNDYKQLVFRQSIVDLCDLPNVIIFMVWGDTRTIDWVKIKILYNGIYDEVIWEWRYVYSSHANSDQNNYPDSNMRVVVWTDIKWDAHMDNVEGSLFPYGFDESILVSGRPVLPIYNNWHFRGLDLPKGWSYFGSYVTPTIASEAQLIFGLYADVKDANQLLEMMESCTADPDYISWNWRRQALQKYSPANFARKYCLTTNIPSSISSGETVTLIKEWYKGIIFEFPGAEVLIDGQWISYEVKNKDLILSQNPMDLEWRLNGNLLRKYDYSTGQTIQGRILSVDDNWKGLKLEKDISIQIK